MQEMSAGRVWPTPSETALCKVWRAYAEKAKAPQREACGAFSVKLMLASAYFPTHNYAVSLAMRCLTAGFGMGPGVPTSLWTPANLGSVDPFPDRIFPSGQDQLIRISIEGSERIIEIKSFDLLVPVS